MVSGTMLTRRPWSWSPSPPTHTHPHPNPHNPAAARRYSLLVGGCVTHRMDLSHMVMLKDNHIWRYASYAHSISGVCVCVCVCVCVLPGETRPFRPVFRLVLLTNW